MPYDLPPPKVYDLFPRSFLTQWIEQDRFFKEEQNGARIYEEGNKLNIEVPMPGLKIEDIDVTLKQGVIQISGSSKNEEKEDDKKRKYYRSSSRNYSYSFSLPAEVDEKQMTAFYTDGVLIVSLQIAKNAEVKKINVTSGKK